jgi:hypothetical protein
VLTLTVALALAGQSPAAPTQTSGPPPTAGVCRREGEALVRWPPVDADALPEIPPRRIQTMPEFPALPVGASAKRNWVGELLVGADGEVRRVWVLQETQLTPPVPAFNEAIVTAVERWVYEPYIVNGLVQPFCLTVTITLEAK